MYVISENGDIFNKSKLSSPLSTWIDGTGYSSVVLYRDKKRCYERVHRLTALAYIPNPLDLPQVNHKDGNKTNNSICNLEWISNQANTKHGYDHGLYRSTYRCPVCAIPKGGECPKEYQSIRSMCEDLGINRKTVTEILKGKKQTNNYPYNFMYIN